MERRVGEGILQKYLTRRSSTAFSTRDGRHIQPGDPHFRGRIRIGRPYFRQRLVRNPRWLRIACRPTGIRVRLRTIRNRSLLHIRLPIRQNIRPCIRRAFQNRFQVLRCVNRSTIRWQGLISPVRQRLLRCIHPNVRTGRGRIVCRRIARPTSGRNHTQESNRYSNESCHGRIVALQALDAPGFVSR